jgi:hypothetical protein
MAPKGSNNNKGNTECDFAPEQQEVIIVKLTDLEALPSKTESLENLPQGHNKKKQQVEAKDKIISDFKAKANRLEQYYQSLSVGINNVSLPIGDFTDTNTVMETLFSKAVLPVFQGGLLPSISFYNTIFETAHILPAKANDPTKPIIARFYSQNIIALVFHHKNELAPLTNANFKGPPNSLQGPDTTSS